MDKTRIRAAFFATLAAVFYAVNVPASKLLLQKIGPTTMAALLYLGALVVMIGGSGLVVADTLIRHHAHQHQHTVTHTHDGTTHRHTVTHSHEHNHYITDGRHGHRHSGKSLVSLLPARHIERTEQT